MSHFLTRRITGNHQGTARNGAGRSGLSIGYNPVRTVFVVFTALWSLAAAVSGSAGEADQEGTGHGYHRNSFGVFLGAALDGREEAPAIGLEYERRFSEQFGIGAVVE